ncbi:peptidase associated/transthyretin-like domain-containing protein [Aquimarina sp. M1]
MQKALYFFISLISFIGFSQKGDVLRGKIINDSLTSKSINIINITKGIGAINDRAGFFQIMAATGDTIVFSSVQHDQKSHVVTKKDLKQANLSIRLAIKVNELEEVTISQYDLSGEIKEDVKNIKTYEDNLPMFNAKFLDSTPFVHEKGAATIRNTTIDHRKNATAFNFIAAGRMIATLFEKKGNQKSKQVRIPEISDFYNGNFLVKELKIPETQLYNFLDYLNQKVETRKVLKSGNELTILEYLISQSKVFNNSLKK